MVTNSRHLGLKTVINCRFENGKNYLIRLMLSNNKPTIRFDSKWKTTIRTALTDSDSYSPRDNISGLADTVPCLVSIAISIASEQLHRAHYTENHRSVIGTSMLPVTFPAI